MSKFVTYVIRLPEDGAARTTIRNGIEGVVAAYGGSITRRSTEDEITLSEKYAERLEDWEAQDAREEAAAEAEAN